MSALCAAAGDSSIRSSDSSRGISGNFTVRVSINHGRDWLIFRNIDFFEFAGAEVRSRAGLELETKSGVSASSVVTNSSQIGAARAKRPTGEAAEGANQRGADGNLLGMLRGLGKYSNRRLLPRRLGSSAGRSIARLMVRPRSSKRYAPRSPAARILPRAAGFSEPARGDVTVASFADYGASIRRCARVAG